MQVTLAGISTEVKPEQKLNVPFSMLVTPFGIVIEVRDEQSPNA